MPTLSCTGTGRPPWPYRRTGTNTLLDGYEQSQMIEVVRHCWTSGKSEKRSTPMSIEPGHRTAVDFLMGHMLLLRGENRRTMQLADCFPLPLKNEGSTSCSAYVCVLDNGNMNSAGQVEYAGLYSTRIHYCVRCRS